MSTVTIGADTFTIYGTLAAMTSFVNGRMGGIYAKWRTITTDDKARTLVMSASYLDSLGLVDTNGDPITETTAIADVITASYELAAALGSKPTITSGGAGGSNIKRVQAGPSDIEFWAPVIAPSQIPPIVLSLIGPYIPVATATATDGGGEAINAGKCPTFTECLEDRFDYKGPL